MTIKHVLSISVIIFEMSISGCLNSKVDKKEKRNVSEQYNKNFDSSFAQSPSVQYQQTIQHYARKLELPTAEGTFDSLLLRLWYYYEQSDIRQVLIIKREPKQWSAQFIEFKSEENGSFNVIATRNEIIPKDGWNKISLAVNELNYLDLTQKRGIGTDGVTYCVEMSSIQGSNFFTYWTPEASELIDSTSKRFSNFLKTLDREFAITRLYKE